MFASASPFSKSHFAEEPDEVGIAVVYNLVFDDTADVSQSGTSGDDTFNLSMPLTTSSGAGFTHSISISGQTGTDTTVITSSGGSGTYFDLTTASIATEQLDAGLNDLILASTSLSNVTIASVDEILFTNAGYYAFDLGQFTNNWFLPRVLSLGDQWRKQGQENRREHVPRGLLETDEGKFHLSH